MLLVEFVLYIGPGLRLGCASRVVADTASDASGVGLSSLGFSACGVVLCGSLCLWCHLCESLCLWCRPLCLLLPSVWSWLHLWFRLNGCHSALFPASGPLSWRLMVLVLNVIGDILRSGFSSMFFLLWLVSITSIPQIRHHIALLCFNAWCGGGGKGSMLACNVYWIVLH